MGKLTFLIH